MVPAEMLKVHHFFQQTLKTAVTVPVYYQISPFFLYSASQCTFPWSQKCALHRLYPSSLFDITGPHVLCILSTAKAKFLFTLSDKAAQCWILLDGSGWEIQFSDSQRNGFGQEQWFSISNSPQGALSFCSSLSLHLVDSIVLFSEQWNGLSSSSVLSGVFVLWNKWTDGPKTSKGLLQARGVCVCLCPWSCMHENLVLVDICVCGVPMTVVSVCICVNVVCT